MSTNTVRYLFFFHVICPQRKVQFIFISLCRNLATVKCSELDNVFAIVHKFEQSGSFAFHHIRETADCRRHTDWLHWPQIHSVRWRICMKCLARNSPRNNTKSVRLCVEVCLFWLLIRIMIEWYRQKKARFCLKNLIPNHFMVHKSFRIISTMFYSMWSTRWWLLVS